VPAPSKRQTNDKSARQQGPQFGPAHASDEERPLPHDLTAERSVLGASRVNPEVAFDAAADVLEPVHFFRAAHGAIFKAMSTMVDKGLIIDLVTLRSELQRVGMLEEVGGPAYIASLGDGVPRSANVEHYARLVKEAAQLREAVYTANKLRADAYSSEKAPADVLSDAAERLLDLSGSAMAGKPTKIGDLVGPGMESLEKSASDGGGAVTGVATGFTSLDEMTAGLQATELVLVAARTSQGKTALAMNIARNVAFSLNVLVFSLEMSKEQIFLRMLASEARVDSHKMRTGYLKDSDWPRIATAITTISELNLYIDDAHSIGVREVRARARQLRQDVGSLGLIIIDYIQLMKGRGKFDNRQQEIGTISRGLKAVAKELRVPVVALAQLGRGMEAGPGRKARRPQLSDLRESGDLEQDADAVVFIYRPDPKDGEEQSDQAELIIGKQRNGPTGTVKVAWDASCVTFDNLGMV
jgi:replicative DNA helicase